MDIEIVNEFIELAKCLNFTESARRLNISQPTLSKHIGTLEKTLHLQLFDRSTTSLRLTREGAELLPFAFKLTESQQNFMDKAKQLKTNAPAQLSIAGLLNEEVVASMLGRILAQLCDTYGNNFLQVKHCHHKLPRQLLEAKEADIVFDYASEKDFENDTLLETIVLARYRWVALVSKNHPLANRDGISLNDLRDETLIQIEGTHLSDAWYYIERACNNHGFEPKVHKHYSMRSTDLLTSAANIGENVLIMGENFTQRVGFGIAPFCTQVPIVDDDAFFPLSAICRMDNPNEILDDALQVFRDIITEVN